MITVFTPTYNRAYKLVDAYNSLLRQTDRNFEWLIVDDGSTDETKSLVSSWIKEGEISIKYIFQQNQGKHIAINIGVENAKNPFFLNLDSDDTMLPNCIETLKEKCKIIESRKDVAGCAFMIATEEYDDYNRFENAGTFEIAFENDFRYRTPYKKEVALCFKKSVLKKYPFPQFKNENFCPESVVYKPITSKFKLLFIRQVLAKGTYLEDGLTAKYWSLLLKNPRGAMSSFGFRIKTEKNESIKRKMIHDYWAIALKAKHISWIEKFRGIPIQYSFQFWYQRLLR